MPFAANAPTNRLHQRVIMRIKPCGHKFQASAQQVKRRKWPAFGIRVFIFGRVVNNVDQLTVLPNDVVMPQLPFAFQFFCDRPRRAGNLEFARGLGRRFDWARSQAGIRYCLWVGI